MTPSPSRATENWLGRGTQKEHRSPLDWVLKANAEADSVCKGLVQEAKAIRLTPNGSKMVEVARPGLMLVRRCASTA